MDDYVTANNGGDTASSKYNVLDLKLEVRVQ